MFKYFQYEVEIKKKRLLLIVLSDAPTGVPSVVPSVTSKYTREIVVLTCNNPEEDGNPDCDIYTWNRIEGSHGSPLSISKTLEFIMNESRAGNYTCTCGNEYGTSGVSYPTEVIILTGMTGSKRTESCRYIK